MGNFRRLNVVLIMIISLFLSSCIDKRFKDDNHKIIYHGHTYDIVLDVKDSIYFIIPGVNANDGDKPIVVNKNGQILEEN